MTSFSFSHSGPAAAPTSNLIRFLNRHAHTLKHIPLCPDRWTISQPPPTFPSLASPRKTRHPKCFFMLALQLGRGEKVRISSSSSEAFDGKDIHKLGGSDDEGEGSEVRSASSTHIHEEWACLGLKGRTSALDYGERRNVTTKVLYKLERNQSEGKVSRFTRRAMWGCLYGKDELRALRLDALVVEGF